MTYKIEIGIIAFMVAIALFIIMHRADAHTRDYRCSMYEQERARIARGGKSNYTPEQIAYYTDLYNQHCRRK